MPFHSDMRFHALFSPDTTIKLKHKIIKLLFFTWTVACVTGYNYKF